MSSRFCGILRSAVARKFLCENASLDLNIDRTLGRCSLPCRTHSLRLSPALPPRLFVHFVSVSVRCVRAQGVTPISFSYNYYERVPETLRMRVCGLCRKSIQFIFRIGSNASTNDRVANMKIAAKRTNVESHLVSEPFASEKFKNRHDWRTRQSLDSRHVRRPFSMKKLPHEFSIKSNMERDSRHQNDVVNRPRGLTFSP